MLKQACQHTLLIVLLRFTDIARTRNFTTVLDLNLLFLGAIFEKRSGRIVVKSEGFTGSKPLVHSVELAIHHSGPWAYSFLRADDEIRDAAVLGRGRRRTWSHRSRHGIVAARA